MTQNRFSDFHCVYTFVQVAHTEFIKVVRTEYSVFKSLRKMIQEQAAAAVVIITLISEKNKRRKTSQKRKTVMGPWLKRKKNLI